MRTSQGSRLSPWPVRAMAVLLFIEAIGLVAFPIDYLLVIDWNTLDDVTQSSGDFTSLSLAVQDQVEIFTISAVFLLFALPTLLASIAVLFRFRSGWLLAMTMQALILGWCLLVYFADTGKPWLIYILMAWSILMVLYLNSYSVRGAIYGRRRARAAEAVEVAIGR